MSQNLTDIVPELIGIGEIAIPTEATAGWTPISTHSYQVSNLNAEVSGGTHTSDATYNYYTFTEDADLTVLTEGLVDVFMIGGGGGGGGETGDANGAGGGGGGGIIVYNNMQLSAGTYPIAIGAGGAGGVGTVNGSVGSPTTFAGFSASGGLDGKCHGSNGVGGFSGYLQASFFSIVQYLGGIAKHDGSPYRGGGGAGTGGNGETGTVSGNGGLGYLLSWNSTRYGGGGGGGCAAGQTAGSGGSGGGGAGRSGNGTATSGSANTGGGGGGAGWQNAVNTGGAGGAGIVIIRTLL